MHVVLEDDQGQLSLRRLRPWHKVAARLLATRLDQELAGGTRPEAGPSLAARAIRLTSTGYRRDLAVSLQRIAAIRSGRGSGHPAIPAYSRTGITRPPHVPVSAARIRRFAPDLQALVDHLVQPGPVPARGVAMVTRLLTDGGGPLYRQACHDDLGALVECATRVLDQGDAP